MRVATFNILNGRSPEDDHVDVSRFAQAIKGLDADVLGLQEVDRNQPRSEKADLTAVAAEAIGADQHRFVAALAGSPGATWMAADGQEQPDAAAYGVALLSRYPVTGWEVIRLPPLPTRVPMRFKGSLRPVLVRDEPRVAVLATVETPQGVMTVVNTHLSFIDWWNVRQLAKIVRSLRSSRHEGPTILLGDLNMGPTRATRITGLHALATHETFPYDEPREQIDHILCDRDLDVVRTEARTLAVSDHRALIADLA